jgi:hypothetical protein
VRFLSGPIAAIQKFAEHAQGMTLGGEPKAVVLVRGTLGEYVRPSRADPRLAT